MARKIVIDKYQGNTHYNVHVIDSFEQEHHLGYYNELPTSVMYELELQAEEIWENEVKREIDLLSNAIHECIQIDEKSGRKPSLD
jgi:hypothetical protein